ncbi:Uncharacterised protein [Bordetella pertussis]|nr:Uncharacterised protein [Bordetella pertussis]CFO35781.1 Uncharacterised protein [Bordetella pertussis]CFP50403.1 Uncharacterised protein [Bordetella pertussis]CFU06552.1 Uncharacterised protein [Bordetella pertussis]CFW14420.1 Uncharacterised protein [Bordetella pertussis]
MARVPASAPGPKMAMNSSAHTSELTERLETRIRRASMLMVRLGVRLLAASRPTGTAIPTDRMVPSVAMCSVSTSAACTPSG